MRKWQKRKFTDTLSIIVKEEREIKDKHGQIPDEQGGGRNVKIVQNSVKSYKAEEEASHYS